MYPSVIVVLVCLRVSQKDHMESLRQGGIEHSPAARNSLAFVSPRALSTLEPSFLGRTIDIRGVELPTYDPRDIELSTRSTDMDVDSKAPALAEERGSR